MYVCAEGKLVTCLERGTVIARPEMNVQHTTSFLYCVQVVQRTATHCNALQHIATHVTHCNSLNRTAKRCNILQHMQRTVTCAGAQLTLCRFEILNKHVMWMFLLGL